jgi:peptide/nickel transport system substrate-binding protein
MTRVLCRTALLLSLLLAGGCASPGLQGSGQQPAPGAQGASGTDRTLIVGIGREPQNLAPFGPLASGLTPVVMSVRPFNAFLELVDDRGVAHPYLAETLPALNTDSWRVFPDGRMETRYRLKPNVTWHDAAPFSAEDLVFAWRAYTTPELGFAAAASAPLNLIDEVSAPDSLSLVIRWRQPYPEAGVLQTGGITNLGLPPLPRHILEGPHRDGQWEAFAQHPYWSTDYVGLGPFRLTEWELGSYLEGVGFDQHVLGKPKIQRLRILFIPDNNTAFAYVRSGSVQLAAEGGVSFDQALVLKREWEATQAGSLLWTAVSLRMLRFQMRPELASPRAILDPRVRKALAHSLDRQALNELSWEGNSPLLDTIFAPTEDYYARIDRALAKYPYDLRATERLMAEAGFGKRPDGVFATTEEPVDFEFISRSGAASERERPVAAVGWRQAGFLVREAGLTPATDRDPQVRATYPAIMDDTQSFIDTILAASFSTAQVARPENRWNGINRGGWSDAEFDRLVSSFNTTLDPDQRVGQRVEMARILSEALPAIFLYNNLSAWLHTSGLTGLSWVVQRSTCYMGWNMHEWQLT